MSLIVRATDTIYTFRFLKVLITPWNKMDAFTLGIIDDEGNILRRASTLTTAKEKAAYTMFHRLVFNIKRILGKLPFGKTRLASFAAALYLLKEETGMSEQAIRRAFNKLSDTVTPIDLALNENTWLLTSQGQLQPGSYILKNPAPLMETYEFRASAGTTIVVPQATSPAGLILGIPVFVVKHRDTNQKVLIALEDIAR